MNPVRKKHADHKASRINTRDSEGEMTSMVKENIRRELFLFWGMHPNAKFTKALISYALDCSKRELDNVIQSMVDAKLVEAHNQEGMTLYSLTADEQLRRPILEFAKHRYWA